MENLYKRAYECLIETSVDNKVDLIKSLYQDFQSGLLSIDQIDLPELINAGHPEKPELVSPREVPKRKLGTDKGRGAAIHSFCHIEFNAINLACDAVFRFQGMPESYYLDWCKIASEEAYHFTILRERLNKLGFDYGDFPAHQGLWELAEKTSGDILERMALIPRVMEARGIDVTPMIKKKFMNVGDQETVDILSIILRDEITHVEAGSRWFRYLCEQRGLDAEATFFKIVKKHMKDHVPCPTYFEARLEAGFSVSELEQLEVLCRRQ